MKIVFAAVINFVSVVHVLGQGDYVGRSRDTVAQKPLELMPKPFDINQGPNMGPVIGPFNSGMGNLQGGGLGIEPDHIKNIIGNTILNKQIIGGQDGFPRHGGTLNPDGLVNGWGANPNVPVIQEVAAWQDPLNGLAFPADYNGQELYFDQSLNRYLIKNTGGLNPGVGSMGFATAQTEHNVVKEANHIAQKTINGMGPFDGVGGVNTGYIKAGSFGPKIVDPIGHGIAKSTDGIIGGHTGHIKHDPFANAAAHGLAKEAVHVAGKTLNIASAGAVPVGPVVGSVPMVQTPAGYGRRI